MLCRCGCGLPAPISPYTDANRGYIKGKHRLYKQGHANRRQCRYKIDEHTGCWNWLLYLYINGYGKLNLRRGKSVAAHIWYYEQKYGAVPQGLELDHLCRNRSCVNPDHLEAVPHAENVHRGNATILTVEQVKEIKSNIKDTSVAISKQYNVCPSTIRKIRTGKNWRNS